MSHHPRTSPSDFENRLLEELHGVIATRSERVLIEAPSRRRVSRRTALATLAAAASVASLAAATTGQLPWQDSVDGFRSDTPSLPASSAFTYQATHDRTAYSTSNEDEYCIARHATATQHLLALTCATPEEFNESGGLIVADPSNSGETPRRIVAALLPDGVSLVAPDGTSVVAKNGFVITEIVGQAPMELTVSGPGALQAIRGLSPERAQSASSIPGSSSASYRVLVTPGSTQLP